MQQYVDMLSLLHSEVSLEGTMAVQRHVSLRDQSSEGAVATVGVTRPVLSFDTTTRPRCQRPGALNGVPPPMPSFTCIHTHALLIRKSLLGFVVRNPFVYREGHRSSKKLNVLAKASTW